MHILILTAHPDDAEIYLYGSLCAWKKMGARLSLIIATAGEAGQRAATAHLDPQALGALRLEETAKAFQPLDMLPQCLHRPDGGLSQDKDLFSALSLKLAELKPDLIVTHDERDYHSDHCALSRAVSQVASFKVPVLYADTLAGTGFEPIFYVDISEYQEEKQQAIQCHLSQEPERFVQAMALQNAFRARQCNAPWGGFAEAFRFKPSYPFADIRALLPPAPPLRRL